MGFFDDISRAASSVVTNVSRAGSSAISSASRAASSAISGASSTVSRTISSAGRGISSIVSNANPVGQAINRTTRNLPSSVSSFLGNALKQVEKATKTVSTAVSQATEAAQKATSGLGGLQNLPGGAVLGSTYGLISNASSGIAAAQKAVDDVIKSGGHVSASILNQIESAKQQVASVRKQIKTATDTTAKSILNAAESATGGKLNLTGLATGLALVNPVTAPLGIAAVASKVGDTITSALTGKSSTNLASVNRSGSTSWNNLNYGNPDVEFTDLKTGESKGYLGQFASPYAADDYYVWFNTGRSNEQVPAGYSGWTDTPDAKALRDYGLSGHVQYSSRPLDAAEREHVLEIYKNHGWLPSKKIGEGLSSVYPETSAITAPAALSQTNDNGGIFGGIASALSGLLGGDNKNNAPASGNILDTVIETRDNMIVGGAVDVISGEDRIGGAVKAGSAMAVDVIAPLDAMNVANKMATGRGSELTAEDWGWAALDVGLLALGAVTGGLGYVGGKGLKAALKGGKNTVKVADVAGDISKGVGSISHLTKGTEAAKGVDEVANYTKYGKKIKQILKENKEIKSALKQSDNIATGGKAADSAKVLEDVGKGADALQTTKASRLGKTLKTGLIGGAVAVTGLSVYNALTGTDASGQVATEDITGEQPVDVVASGGDQGYLQDQIDDIVDFLNDAFGGGSGGSGSGSDPATGGGGGGSVSGGSGGVVADAVEAVGNVPVVGDIIKALADRGLLIPVVIGGIILAGLAYYLKGNKKTSSGSRSTTRKSTKKRGASA